MTNRTRYLAITRWARRRYLTGGRYVGSTAAQLAAYTRIERAAWTRYA